MLATLLPYFALLFGIAGLIVGADRFVLGSAGAAKNFGISPLVIGLTVVSIGTSAPEVIVSVSAALRDASALAVGNALGSNLANIGLVLGVTLLIAPLPVQRHLIVEEGPALLLVTLLAGIMLFNNYLGRWESVGLMLLAIPLLIATVKYKQHHPDPELVAEGETVIALSNKTAALWIVVGLGVLLLCAEITVWGATQIATQLGVSELIIGLTVVAIGTSLPELAASVVSAIKGHTDIALGNVLGSNLFNLMLVMSSAGIIQPSAMDSAVFSRDYLSMALLTVILVAVIAWALRRGTALRRPVGALLLLCYGGYYALLAPALL
ncbi:calcium/sodium antiporter [Gammaproteobacteria bacterium LSUCC0057]|uniref:Calcium/sodium antiporter n=1 Tax=Gammaproteobacteria bacterium LSUCC0057 TaxID=2559237 RepID=A0A4Y8UGD1_9GAMM|nr:calcium/sodium antiporter [Gammaproteobacteria bacterium LSUCC0057]